MHPRYAPPTGEPLIFATADTVADAIVRDRPFGSRTGVESSAPVRAISCLLILLAGPTFHREAPSLREQHSGSAARSRPGDRRLKRSGRATSVSAYANTPNPELGDRAEVV